MEAEAVPAGVRFLVASDADEASRRQKEELLGLASWTSGRPFGNTETWRHRDLCLVTIPEEHLYRDYLDRDLNSATGGPVELVVYLSKHRSESGRPSLTVHPIGNPGAADFGGQAGTLVPSAPRWMTAALRGLRRESEGLGYEVTFEATHHGPYLMAPTFYIEQGSTAREWADREAARVIAQVLLDLKPVDAPIAIGLGGGHYVPRHTDVALRKHVAFGHLIPTYALETSTPDLIDQAFERTAGATVAYLHRKAVAKPLLRSTQKRLESLGLRVIREGDLDPILEDETS